MSAPQNFSIVWDGIPVEITYHQRRWSSDFDHIELRVPTGHVLPVSETGYRSHFLPHGVVEEYGDAQGFVSAWFDHEAKSPEWKARKDAARQMSLF